MIDLDKERELFEATRVGDFNNVEFEINDYWKTGHYKEKTSHNDDIEDAINLSSSWYSWLERAELAQAEKDLLKKEIDYLDVARKCSNSYLLEANYEIKKLKQQLALYENSDCVLIPKEPKEKLTKALERGFSWGEDGDGEYNPITGYKALIETMEKSNE